MLQPEPFGFSTTLISSAFWSAPREAAALCSCCSSCRFRVSAFFNAAYHTMLVCYTFNILICADLGLQQTLQQCGYRPHFYRLELQVLLHLPPCLCGWSHQEHSLPWYAPWASSGWRRDCYCGYPAQARSHQLSSSSCLGFCLWLRFAVACGWELGY